MNHLLFFSKVFFSILLLSSTLHAIELNWEHNYKNALATAKKEHKMVYLFIGADRCTHCERFKEQTLSSKDLIEDMKEDYILLYMSRDQDLIPEKFELYGVPRHYFLTSKGEIITEYQGIWDPSGLYSLLDEAISEKDNL